MPGPACYRRGGPLTVTDCNVMLGKLEPDSSRACSARAATSRSTAARRRRNSPRSRPRSRPRPATGAVPHEIADGFLRIAVENMANAIKQISIERGYDVTEYTLCCFGGAGGQHACLVADALGMKRVYIHPLAGVLSAYGMGLGRSADAQGAGDRGAARGGGDAELAAMLDRLAGRGHGGDARRRASRRTASRCWRKSHVKYDGTDTPLDGRRMGRSDEISRRLRGGASAALRLRHAGEAAGGRGRVGGGGGRHRHRGGRGLRRARPRRVRPMPLARVAIYHRRARSTRRRSTTATRCCRGSSRRPGDHPREDRNDGASSPAGARGSTGRRYLVLRARRGAAAPTRHRHRRSIR